MLKKFIIYLVVFLSAGTTSFFLQRFLLSEVDLAFIPILKSTYQFHGLFSLALVSVFFVLSKNEKAFQQLGFLYIAFLVFKITLFVVSFYEPLLGDNSLSRFYRASLMVPIILFLILEVLFVSKIMRSQKA